MQSNMENKIYKYLLNCYVPHDVLLVLKEYYKDLIASNRRMRYIKDFKDLLIILKKRDEISLDHLETIIYKIGDQRIIDQYQRIKSGQNSFPGSTGAIYRNSSGNNFRNANNWCSPRSPEAPPRKVALLDEVYTLICNQLGSRWREVARYLEVPESQIDDLKNTRLNTRECILFVLNYHERNCRNYRWRQKLLLALGEAQRNDLRKKVEGKLDEFQIL